MERRRAFLCVASLALLSRIPFLFVNRGLLYDEALYLSIGRNLSQNISDYTMNLNYMTYRPPLLPYLISLIFRLHLSEAGARLISPLFSCATILLTYHYTEKHFSQRTALLASLILITSPLFLTYSLRILAHEPFAFFYTLSVFLFYEGLREKRKLYVAGAVAGLAYLTRYVGVMFFCFIFFYFLFLNLRTVRRIILLPLRNIHLMGCLFSFIVVIAPWSCFNYVIYHDPFKYAKVASDVIRLDLTTSFSAFIASTLGEVTPWILIFLCVGIYGFLRKRNIFMLAWISGSLAVFLIVTHKESRYLADFFPLIAITAAAGYEILDPMLKGKMFLALFIALSCVSFAVGIVDVYEKKDIGKPLMYVGNFISAHTPQDFPIIANEESQMYYYTGRKIYPFPNTREEFETLRQERKVIFMVVNSYRKPDYFEEIVGGWEEIFMRGSYTVYRRRDHGCTLCLF